MSRQWKDPKNSLTQAFQSKSNRISDLSFHWALNTKWMNWNVSINEKSLYEKSKFFRNAIEFSFDVRRGTIKDRCVIYQYDLVNELNSSCKCTITNPFQIKVGHEEKNLQNFFKCNEKCFLFDIKFIRFYFLTYNLSTSIIRDLLV